MPETPSHNTFNETPNDAEARKDASIKATDVEKAPLQNGWSQGGGGGAGGPPSFPDGGTRAWLVVLGGMIVMGCSFGYISAFGVYETYYQTHQLADKTESDIAWIGSIQLCFQFGSGLFAGSLFDRVGSRPQAIMIPATISYTFSIMMTSLCKEYYQFILAQGILGGISVGFLFTPASSAVNQYFHAKRGIAMGIITVGSSIGGLIFPIALQNAFNSQRLGFGWGVRTVGFVIFALMSISCVLIKERLPHRKGGFFLPGAFKDPSYTFMTAGVFLLIWSMFVPYFFLASYALARTSMSERMAFYLLTILNAASAVGRIFGGGLADHLGRLNMLIFISISTGIIILLWTKATTNAGLIAWTAVFGGFSGAVISLFPAGFAQLAPEPRVIGTYLGQSMGVISLAGLTGTPIAGAILTRYGWGSMAVFSGVAMCIGGVLIGVARFFKDGRLRAVV